MWYLWKILFIDKKPPVLIFSVFTSRSSFSFICHIWCYEYINIYRFVDNTAIFSLLAVRKIKVHDITNALENIHKSACMDAWYLLNRPIEEKHSQLLHWTFPRFNDDDYDDVPWGSWCYRLCYYHRCWWWRRCPARGLNERTSSSVHIGKISISFNFK